MAKVPKPFKSGELVAFKTNIYQISDSGLHDLCYKYDKDSYSGKDGFLFQDYAKAEVRGNLKNAKRYEKFIKMKISKKVGKLYFKTNSANEKAIIFDGVNQNDIILEKIGGGTFGAYDKRIVKYLKKVKK